MGKRLSRYFTSLLQELKITAQSFLAQGEAMAQCEADNTMDLLEGETALEHLEYLLYKLYF